MKIKIPKMYMYTFNIERYLSHYVENAKRVEVRNFSYTYKDGILNKNKWSYVKICCV